MLENVGSIKTWSAKRKSRHIKFCKQNTAMLIVLRENYKLCKISTRHRKNSKQSGIVAIDSCFALAGARQYGVTTRKLWCKISALYDLSSDLEPSTPTESRHTTRLLGGKSPSVKLMSHLVGLITCKLSINLNLNSFARVYTPLSQIIITINIFT